MPRSPSPARFLAPLLVALACGESEPTPPPVTEFTVTAAPTSLSLRQGESGAVNVVTGVTSGPGTQFTFTVEGSPAGVAITPPPTAVNVATGASATTTFAVIVSPTATLGTASVTVRAKTTAGSEKTTSFSLVVTPPPSYTLTATPLAQTINQGAQGAAVVSIARTGFEAPILVAMEGAPLGMAGVFSPPTVTGSTSVVTILVASSVSVGSYPVVIRGTAAGLPDRTAAMTVTVAAVPSFSLSVKTPTRTVVTGGSVTDSVFIARSNFTDGVSLSLDSPNPDITGAFAPGATTGASSVLTLSVGAAVPPGAYIVTVRGNATGAATQTAAINLTVALPPPDVALSLTPTTLSVEAGQSGTSTVGIARTNFVGAVTLALDAPPAGITGTFAPSSTTANASQLTLAVASSVAPGAYTLTVKGTGAGIADRTATLTLTVTAPPSSIGLSVVPDSLALFQGATASMTATLTRANYTQPITLAASAVPVGLTVTVPSTPVAGTSGALTVVAASTLAAGRYTFTLTASGTGVAPATRQVVVNVSAIGAGALQFSFCDPNAPTVFFAYQDSTGPWTAVTPAVAGNVTRFAFDLVSNRGAVAFITRRSTTTPLVGTPALGRRNRLVQASTLAARTAAARRAASGPGTFARSASAFALADIYETTVYHLARTEMNAVGADVCTGVVATKTNLVNVAGVGVGQTGTLSLGGINRTFVGGTTTSPLTFTGVPARTVDLVATRASLSEGYERGVILRGLNVPAGGTLGSTVDFAGPTAFQPATAVASIANSFAHVLQLSSLVFTANGEAGVFGADPTPSAAQARVWAGVPAASFQTTDLHGLLVHATPTVPVPNEFRTLLQYTGAVANTVLTLGPEMNLVTVLPVTAGVFRAFAPLPPGLQQGVDISFAPAVGTGNTLKMVATGAFLTNTATFPSFDLTTPVLNGLTGYPTAAKLTTGTNDVRVTGLGWTGTGITAPRAIAGDQLRTGSRGAQVVVP